MPCDYLKVLNLAKNGQWNAAHELVQSFSDPFSCRIHAYLHRVEGDLSNALYWYKRAGVDMPAGNLQDELSRLYEMLATGTTTPSN